MISILIVEDDTNIQRLLSYTLRKANYAIQIASNGQEGLHALAEAPYDLAIIDLAMPVMNGLTMLRQLRANPATNRLPVIMLTASADDHLRLDLEAETISAFLTKPASSRTLLKTISNVLGEQDSNEETT